MSFFVLNIFLGFVGLLLSLYITHKKRRKSEHFVCPLRGDCHDVIQSDYSKFLGMPVEVLGVIYYAVIAISYGVRAFWPILNGLFAVALLFISTFALVFSFYLTFIQVVALKKLCTWCLTSAFLTLCIFLISVHISFESLVPFLVQVKPAIWILHVLAMAIGLGAATVADLFFFKFLKDFRISQMEAGILKLFSQFIWLALGLIIMTWLGLFIPQSETLLASDQFIMKVIIIAVVMVNAALLNLLVVPRFLHIQFGKHHHRPGELVRTRHLAFVLGPISIVSWYCAFVLLMLGTAPASFNTMMYGYLLLLVIAIFIGQVAERVIDWQARHHTQ